MLITVVKSNLANTLPAHDKNAYPAVMQSAFEMLPCSWSEGPSVNQTHVFPEFHAGKEAESERGLAQEELMKFVDAVIFTKLRLIYALRAASLRHAYQQAAAIAEDAMVTRGPAHETARSSRHSSLMFTPAVADIFLLLPFGRDRRIFARQAREAALGRPIQVRLLTDARVTLGLSRVEVKHKEDASVQLLIDIIELPSENAAFTRLMNITRHDATASAEADRRLVWREHEEDGLMKRAADMWQEGWAWLQLAASLLQVGGAAPAHEPMPHDLDEDPAGSPHGRGLTARALGSVCRCWLGAVEANCFEKVPAISYLTRLYGSTRGTNAAVSPDPLLLPALALSHPLSPQSHAACLLSRRRCSGGAYARAVSVRTSDVPHDGRNHLHGLDMLSCFRRNTPLTKVP